MDKGREPLFLWLVSLLIATGCSTACKTAPAKTTVAKTPVEALSKAQAQTQLSKLPAPPPPQVLSRIQQKPTFDLVDQTIKDSEARFLEGERDLKAGFREKARRNFDMSLEIVLRSGIAVRQQERLERHLEGLIDRIHNYELAALKEGDGFSEERYESAPIDEFASGDVPLTFDPRSRVLAEETLMQVPHDIPLVINDTVLRFLDYFQNRGRKSLEAGMQRAGRYRVMISKILAEEGVPQDLIYLCQVESSFKPLALSNKKCKGMWQFDAWRGQYYGLRQNWWIDERSDPEKSTRAAARHLKDLYNQFGDWFLAMAAYNTGPGNVERAIERTGFADYWELVKRGTLHPDTVSYVPMILAMAIVSKDPAKYGFDAVTPEPPVPVDKVEIDSAIDLRLAAELLDIELADLKEINPHVRRLTTPRNDPEFTLYLPAGRREKFLQEIASIPEEMRVTWRMHRVEEGETLSVIAKKYHTTSSAISQANNLADGQKIQVDGKLIIPVAPGKSGASAELAQSSMVRYTLRRGDTIASVANEFEVTVAQIRRWNRLSAKSKLRPGRVIVIYPPGFVAQVERKKNGLKSATNTNRESSTRVIHQVKKGETLFAIAANYKIPIDSIRDWNKLSQSENLKAGDKLTIYLNR